MAKVKAVAVTMGMRVVAARVAAAVAAAKEVARAEAMAEVARVVAAEVAMARATVEMAFDAKRRKGGRRMQATAAWRERRR